jgi:hypothetical protein
MQITAGKCPQAKRRNFLNLLNEFLEEKVLSENKILKYKSKENSTSS